MCANSFEFWLKLTDLELFLFPFVFDVYAWHTNMSFHSDIVIYVIFIYIT